MMKYYTYTSDVVEALESSSPAFFKTQTTSDDHFAKSMNQEETKNPEKRSASQQTEMINLT